MKKDELIKENNNLMMTLYYAEAEKKELREENDKLNNYITFLLDQVDKLTLENVALEKRFRFSHAS